MATRRRSILVIGDAFCDVNAGPLASLPQWGTNTISPEAIAVHAGGAALNVASGLQQLRGDTHLFTGLGQDGFGELLRRHCSSLGMDVIEAVDRSTPLPTGVCIVLSGRKDRAFCSHFGVADAFDAALLLEHDGAALRRLQPPLGHVHVAGYYSCGALRKTLPSLLTLVRALGATTSLDTNHDATGAWGEVDGLWERILPLVDIFMPNELEAMAIARSPTVDVALARLSERVAGAVVITRGAQGCILGGSALQTTHLPAPYVDAIDAVGAGDAFKSGVLAAYVAGAPLREACELGNVTGALCVTKRGACAQPPSFEEVCQFARCHDCQVHGSVVSLLEGAKTRSMAHCDGGDGSGDGSGDCDAAASGGGGGGCGNESVGANEAPRARLLASSTGATSGELRLLWWGFCIMWAGGTWPYQAMLQAQAYYAHELPDLSLFLLLTFTWPLRAPPPPPPRGRMHFA